MRQYVVYMLCVLASFALLMLFQSCVTPKMEEYNASDCVKIKTPYGVPNYYICEDPISICYLTTEGGIDCMPKATDEEFDEEDADAEPSIMTL